MTRTLYLIRFWYAMPWRSIERYGWPPGGYGWAEPKWRELGRES